MPHAYLFPISAGVSAEGEEVPYDPAEEELIRANTQTNAGSMGLTPGAHFTARIRARIDQLTSCVRVIDSEVVDRAPRNSASPLSSLQASPAAANLKSSSSLTKGILLVDSLGEGREEGTSC
eukprot:605857-Rhodomonas_salina.1